MSSQHLQQSPTGEPVTTTSGRYELLFRRIVVGYERDEEARKAMQIASILSGDLGSEIVVAATVPPPAATPLDTINPDLFGEVLRDFQRRLLDDLHAHGYYHDDKVLVSMDSPVDHILHTAAEQNADLILVGSHGRHGFSQLVLGSVSESLATKSKCPVMIVGPECQIPDGALRSILFATDLENTGICAGQVAAGLARKAACSLTVLHVRGRKPTPAGREREWEEDHLREQMRLTVLEDRRRDAAPICQIKYGEPGDEILTAAESCGAGLIVVGGGEHRILADHLPWRTLTPILEFARCPVIVVSRNCP